jgi:hypothetical protein
VQERGRHTLIGKNNASVGVIGEYMPSSLCWNLVRTLYGGRVWAWREAGSCRRKSSEIFGTRFGIGVKDGQGQYMRHVTWLYLGLGRIRSTYS